DLDDFVTFLFVIALKPFDYLGNIYFCGLVPGMYGNAIFNIPNADDHRHLQHALSVDGLKEKTFTGTDVTNGSPCYFISIFRKIGGVDALYMTIDFGGLGQS